MTPLPRRSRSSRLIPAFLLALGALASARAQFTLAGTSAIVLDDYVISASRTPQDPRYTPSSVSVLPLADLAAAQVPDLRLALAQEPGVIINTTGATGGQSSVLLRGAASHQVLFIVDGVRMNDRSAAYFNFLGGADLAGLDRVEVLRGPQSTLYGSSAMGGVILMNTTRGAGAAHGALSATAGSFETWGGGATVQGSTGSWGYSGALSRYATANDEPSNDYEQWSYSTRQEWIVSPLLLVGATLRGQQSEFLQTGSRDYPAPGRMNARNHLGTVYGEARVGDDFASRLTLALHRRGYDWTDLSGSPWAMNSRLRNTRKILDWQNTWQALPALELVGGANWERSRYDVEGVPSRDEVRAGYVSATARPREDFTVTAGARRDDFDSAGAATTWRMGVSWLAAKATKLRATYGTGFSAPGSDDRYGVPSWNQLPNPELRPEKSRGWDVGLDQTFARADLTVGVTYFHNRFRNLFEWQTVDWTTYAGQTVNLARAETEGVELAARAKLGAAAQARLSYTYLEAKDSATGQRLIRRPRHSGDAEVRAHLTKAWLVGVGVRVVADRTESTGPFEDFTTARVFASYTVRDDLELKVRIENALDETYDEVRGYASLPRGVFGSVEWRF
ncbi:TonB-dependent receptor plug domain-containing protein [Opitutus terrae]|uniref:TonB-dependent receptor n=1 Tax=Opitutus terrae (strain DSM 11246 / JCM 15787 / PB90-1) TaxID=452637 RepID=B1ZXH8_OPITP|nr:TonB-dependent receptor [Opitutus terrae]ACB76973.1 TonB-dependent receptor [Opitutus terrae PB90-1]